MILIFSQATHEPTTEFVMDWLEDLGASCLRLNGEDLDGDCSVSLRLSTEGAELTLDAGEDGGGPLPLRQIKAAWYRRWQSHQRHGAVEMVDRRLGIEQQARLDLYRHLNIEGRKLSEMLYAHLSKVPWLNTPASASPNKLLVLERAAAAGLEIPATLVTTRRAEVEAFAAVHGELITKPIGEAHSFYLEGEYHSLHTLALSAADIAGLPDAFPASLFQERLDKRYELRVFYLAGECHAMAIFSQRDPQTQVDFRNYNFAHPNRNVPYRVSAATAAAIDVLMRGLGLGTGSLDLVRTSDGRLVFLEVNPNGQFTMVSRPCNYNLERRVAETLIASAAHHGPA
jgi:ATP-GRASP peptide maturase of grasp-with-spasm system